MKKQENIGQKAGKQGQRVTGCDRLGGLTTGLARAELALEEARELEPRNPL